MTTRYPSPAMRVRLRPRRRTRQRLRVLLAAACFALGAVASAAFGASCGRLLPNVPVPTLGGTQLWTDVAFEDGWKVQRHAWTGHARLLDPEGVRRGWGDEAACCARLAEVAVAPDTAPLVILVHGLARSHRSLGVLEARLEEEGYEVLAFEYASTRGTLDEHADALATLLARHAEPREVSFVTHSLGGLVVRALLADEGAPWREVHRLGRAVTLAAPHQGAAVARVAAAWRIPRWVMGPALAALADGTAAALPEPCLPFATVAGVRGDGRGWNPAAPGDDDGLVSAAEATLPGAAATLEREVLHTFVMSDPEVLDFVVEFLGGR